MEDSDSPKAEQKDISPVFDDELESLLKVCSSILNLHSKRDIMGNNVMAKRLKSYRKCYQKSEECDREAHAWPFKDIFERQKTRILKGLKNDDWILRTTLCVQYGSHNGSKNNIKIHLSSIYGIAVKMSKASKKKYKDLPNEEYAKHVEIIYPEAMLLHLYRIFRELCRVPVYNKVYIAKDTELESLSKIITSLEKELGISVKSANGDFGSDGGFNDIFDMAKGFLGRMGMEVPADAPKGSDMRDAISKMLNDDSTADLIGNIVKSVQGSNDIGEIVSKIAGGLGDPALAETLAKTIPGTIEGVKSVSKDEEEVPEDSSDDEFLT